MSSILIMTPFAEFLEHLFATGDARLSELPESDDSNAVQRILQAAFQDYRLEIAGLPIPFEPNAAIAAAVFMARCCWFAVSRDEPPADVLEILHPLSEPKSPGAHLSIDLTLRYTLTIYRRAWSQNEKDVLVKRLADVLRRCPLTGVLSDITEPPTGDMTFGEHSGLQLLYAERLAGNVRPHWIPGEGGSLEHVRMVFERLGVAMPQK